MMDRNAPNFGQVYENLFQISFKPPSVTISALSRSWSVEEVEITANEIRWHGGSINRLTGSFSDWWGSVGKCEQAPTKNKF